MKSDSIFYKANFYLYENDILYYARKEKMD